MVVDQSSIYESEPWGKKDQAFFLNQVVKVRSALKAEALLVKIQEIEKKMGRIRKEQWGPRTIDIDILFYNSRIISEENLIIPHARAHERRFVIMPMAELSPSFVHPVLNQNMMVLSMTCIDMSKITKYKG
jgi:2-amino-4-hydroxy-6-hydroxymethyldihydropteridine diphosphokinase